MQKARSQPFLAEARHRPPTARSFMVSGTFHSPHRGAFQLSLTVLSLPVVQEYLALRGGPREFTPGFTCPVLLGIPPGVPCLSPTGLSPSAEALSRAFG